jgi:integration host factor subunit beta
MTKSELIKLMKEKHPELQLKEAATLVEIFFEMMSDTLSNQGRVEIRGFGTFSLRTRKPRQARNPRTGEKVDIGERNSVYFRAGKALKTKINV